MKNNSSNKFCNHCNHVLDPKAMFCPTCGKPVSVGVSKEISKVNIVLHSSMFKEICVACL